MRTNFKKAIMPLAVVVLGAAAAFATNAAKQSTKAEATMWGYHYDNTRPVGQKCVPLEVDCNTVQGPICTIAGITYYQSPIESAGLQCSFALRKNN